MGAEFVLHFLDDRFDGALIVAMGCDGLSSHDLAKAFMEAGAAAYVSWDGPVSLVHTDEATLAMLKGLVADEMCLRDAVRHSMELVGPDPSYASSLCIYPRTRGCSVSIKKAWVDRLLVILLSILKTNYRESPSMFYRHPCQSS